MKPRYSVFQGTGRNYALYQDSLYCQHINNFWRPKFVCFISGIMLKAGVLQRGFTVLWLFLFSFDWQTFSMIAFFFLCFLSFLFVEKKRWIGQDYLLPLFFFSALILLGLLVAFILLFCLDFGGLSGQLTRQSRGQNLVQSLFLMALVLSKKAESGGRRRTEMKSQVTMMRVLVHIKIRFWLDPTTIGYNF